MRLILIAAILTFIIIESKSQNVHDYKYQRNSPGPDMFSSDPSSLYLPPESHQAIPLFPMKNVNNLQFPYLPATGTKAPSIYPTPFPMLMSSLLPNFDDEEDDNENDENEGKIQLSSPPTPPRQNFSQNSERSANADNKEPRMLPRPILYHKQPIDRADVKQLQVPPVQMFNSPNVRRMIISSENARSDQVPDQIKTGSHPGYQFLPPSAVYNVPTTEPAIPIIRLSNEMDLDGSFSYEALGADQTHYVQHSRMENMGTDKEEQVVEGSYSYVGDNGQTYTVHYVADSNGFRASGDHLPVPPPVPEIIQRAVQYNIAEETKRPPHLKSQWEDDVKDYEIGEREKNTFSVLPPRNLFTGRTPEAFSYSYGHGPAPNSQNNNIAVAASNQVPVKTVDFSKEQTNQNKPNSGPIAPQVTFLASQGAHLPSVNTPPQEPPSISRMFPAERLLPQLLSYQAKIKDNEENNNKALWRWQYGVNPNNVNRQAKNSISRSSADAGDDVMINFNNMTPEEYTNMIHSQYSGNENEGKGFSQNSNNEHVTKAPNHNYYVHPNQNYIPQGYVNNAQSFDAPTPSSKVSFPHSSDWYTQKTYDNDNNRTQSEVSFPSQSQNLPESSVTYNQPQVNLEQKTLQRDQSQQHPQIQQQYAHLQIQNPPQQQYLYPQQQYLQTQQQLETESQTTQGKENKETVKQYEENETPEKKDVSQITTVNQEKENNVKSYPILKTESSSTSNQEDYVNTESATTIDYETDFFDVKKVSSQNYGSNVHKIYSTAPNMYWISTEPSLPLQIKVTTQEPTPTSTYSRSLQFSDFIVKDVQDDFTPITYSNKESQVEREMTTTTAESTTSLKEMLDNNIFLKNFVKPDNSRRGENIISDEPKKQAPKKTTMEQKVDKTPKYIYPTQNNDVKIFKKKPLDMGELLNFVAIKNHFESSKVKGINKPLFSDNYTPRRETYYTNSNENDDDEEEEEKKTFSVKKNLNQQQQHELRGLIRNYKVLQRNNNINHESHQNRNDYKPIPLKMMHPPSNLPPLGRAGPTVKAYLPPIYV